MKTYKIKKRIRPYRGKYKIPTHKHTKVRRPKSEYILTCWNANYGADSVSVTSAYRFTDLTKKPKDSFADEYKQKVNMALREQYDLEKDKLELQYDLDKLDVELDIFGNELKKLQPIKPPTVEHWDSIEPISKLNLSYPKPHKLGIFENLKHHTIDKLRKGKYNGK